MGPPSYEALLGALRRIEELLQFPGIPGNIDKATFLALAIVATGPGPIADLAIRGSDGGQCAASELI